MLGREHDADIKIEDLAVSRKHCRLRRDHNSWILEDLGSANGTFVNGHAKPVHILLSGDTFSVGDHSFLYLSEDSDGPDCVEWHHADHITDATVRSVPASHAAETGLREDDQDLRRLVDLIPGLSFDCGLQAMQHQVLQAAIQLVDGTRGAIVMFSGTPDEIRAAYGSAGGSSSCVAVSNSILKRIYSEKQALIWRRSESAQFNTESLRASGAATVLATPLLIRGNVSGAIYLEARNTATDRALLLLGALAAIVAQPLDGAYRLDQLEAENRQLRSDAGLARAFVGRSAALRRVYETLARIAPTDSTVLLLGETGTGKELAARSLHDHSRRADQPFVAINCAAIAENLLESELFGHERGAFTGATAQKKGKLELAGKGTLFLDEVGELGLLLQAKLLRVIQEREMERVGGTRAIRMEARLVAATNRDLSALIAEGRFRSDLYYRLNIVSLRLPPLRERREDVLLLADHFLSVLSASANRTITGISTAARAILLRHTWPGNVRELRNAIERAVVLGQSEQVEVDDLPEEMLDPSIFDESDTGYHALVRQAKVAILRAALAEHGKDYTAAARRLGINVKYLHRLLKAYELKG